MATRLSASGPGVAAKVVDALVNVELDRRAGLVHAALRKVDELVEKRKKINDPDVTNFDGEGKEVKMTSAGRMGDRKKLDKEIEQLNAAVDAAIGETDADKQRAAYDAIERATKAKGGEGNGGGDKA